VDWISRCGCIESIKDAVALFFTEQAVRRQRRFGIGGDGLEQADEARAETLNRGGVEEIG
jgi:hypothetical protein